MKAVRLKIRQTSANYRREETVDNKMTYPLPPYSTVIGAVHKACGYQTYHPMDISIQGTYGALKKEVYQEHCFLNVTQNDRGILVKMQNPDLLSKAFIKVASAKKSQGNDFRKGITIQVHDEECLEEYRTLKDKKDQLILFKKERIIPLFDQIKKYKKVLAERKKRYSDKKERLSLIQQREKEIKELERKIKTRLKLYEEETITKPYSRFRTLTCGPKYYEVLSDIELVIHIKSDEQVMKDIISNQYNFTSLGRSEDFVEIMEAVLVDLEEAEEDCSSILPTYVPASFLDSESIEIVEKNGIPAGGTRYYLPKNYKLEDGIRIFERKSVVYLSKFWIYDQSDSAEKIYMDQESEQDYLVCFA